MIHPPDWKRIVGHKRQIEQLSNTLTEGRLPNAWLFAGIRGIGKRLTAETLAAAICCRESAAPCGACVACTKVAKESHPDVFIVEPEKQRLKIDQVRDLAQRVQFHPLEASAKVVIIDDADAMTEAAANSLLKLLEEPPANTHLVLITAAAHRILPTIRSRCRRMAFSPLSDEEIAAHLERAEGFSQNDARRAAHLAQGSLGVARELNAELVEDVLGRFEALSKRASAADIIETSEAWAGDPARTALILDILAGQFRDRLRDAAMTATDVHAMRSVMDGLRNIAWARDLAETTANKQLMFEQLLFSVTAT